MPNQIQTIKDATDIVALIGERVKLTKTGANYKGLCPFHSEKSPSFFVNPQMQRYICFGCHESGDCFTFLQTYEHASFYEALQMLAKKAGIELERTHGTPADLQKERLLSLLSLAKEFYHFLLLSHPSGEQARSYLYERGMHDSTVELFGLGAAPAAWDGLKKYAIEKKGYTEQELIDAGLLVKSDSGHTYDRFRDRLVFPLTNPRGQVVGFSARSLNPDEKTAKYINSPETLLYHKSELLFGFSQLHRFIREKEEVLVVEGEFDVLSSVQAYVQNIVAIKGSALSTSQLQLLSRNVKRIIFSLDNDKAGIEATKRAITLARPFDISLRVLLMTDGKDPDDIARHDPAAWRTLVQKHSVSVYEYLINQSLRTHDVTSGEGKKEITNEILPIIAAIPNAVEQAHYVTFLSKQLNVREEVLLTQMRQQPFIPSQETTTPKEEPIDPRPRDVIIAEYVISLLLHADSAVFARFVSQVRTLVHDAFQVRVMEVLVGMKSSFSLQAMARTLPEELKEGVNQLYLRYDEEMKPETLPQELESSIAKLEKLTQNLTRERIAKRLTELEGISDLSPEQEQEMAQLLAKLQTV